MARTDIFNSDDLDLDTEAPETAFEEGMDEAPAEGTEVVAEAPAEESADDKKAKQAAADAEHLPAVEDFKTAVTEAVDNADESTGTVSLDDLNKVGEAYREVKGGIKYKNLAKTWVAEQMSASIKDGEFTKAVAFNEVNEHLNTQTASASSGPAAPKVDPKVAFAERLAAFELVVDLVTANVPEGAEDFEPVDTTAAFDQASEYLAWEKADEEHRGDEPEVGPIAAAALKLFHGKGLGARRVGAKSTAGGATYSGPRRNVANHITSAFEGVESGTFLKISDIAAHKSEEYGDSQPSSGAIAARLFPSNDKGCTIPGITPGEDASGTKGATKD